MSKNEEGREENVKIEWAEGNCVANFICFALLLLTRKGGREEEKLELKGGTDMAAAGRSLGMEKQQRRKKKMLRKFCLPLTFGGDKSQQKKGWALGKWI